MGTMIQERKFGESDFRGERLKDHTHDLRGNNDILILTQSDAIRALHYHYFIAGADICCTNTFSSTRIAQSDYGCQDLVLELNREGARLAREARRPGRKTDGKRRFVAGAMGPTNRTASISPDVSDPGFRAVTFDELRANYAEAAQGLLEGGADILLVETIFDTLNAKAAYAGVTDAFAKTGIERPLMMSGTITDLSGRTLSGQTPEAFWNALRHTNPLAIGLNCALGAKELRAHVAELSKIADTLVCAYPNAGLPNEFGLYDESPDFMSDLLQEFAKSGLVNIVGGCCGTTPDHIRAFADKLEGVKPREIPSVERRLRLSGLDPFTLTDDIRFVNVGERTNVTGSARFRKLIKNGDYAAALDVARDQVANGAQIIDINMDEGLLDSADAMVKFCNLIAAEPDIARAPIMVDSSKFEVIEAGLKCIQGKAVVNSISLKEGEEKFLEQAAIVRLYGAAVVVMAFDEQGQADTYERKVEICARAYKLLTEKAGFPPEDIIFDPNIFAVATGIEEHNGYGVAFIDATREIRRTLPTFMCRAASPIFPSPSAATNPCARRCTRSSSTTPSKRAWTWASSTPASSPSMKTSIRNCAKPAKTLSSIATPTPPSACSKSLKIIAAPAARRGPRIFPGARRRLQSVSNTPSSTASPNSSIRTPKKRARTPHGRLTSSKVR